MSVLNAWHAVLFFTALGRDIYLWGLQTAEPWSFLNKNWVSVVPASCIAFNFPTNSVVDNPPFTGEDALQSGWVRKRLFGRTGIQTLIRFPNSAVPLCSGAGVRKRQFSMDHILPGTCVCTAQELEIVPHF